MDTLADFVHTDTQHFDVLIVGAGLSGIGAAWHLQKECPGKSYAIVEAREASGGTWDLFRYPGVRSDSDMYTLGYRFRPWKDAKAIADGPAILSYIREVASDHGIDRKIRYRHRRLQGPGCASAALAQGSRLCGQEGRGDRLGRDGRDRGAVDGGDRGPRHHAAALTDLCRGAAGTGPDRQQAQAPPAAQARLY